jgi:hypothetical protein
MAANQRPKIHPSTQRQSPASKRVTAGKVIAVTMQVIITWLRLFVLLPAPSVCDAIMKIL